MAKAQENKPNSRTIHFKLGDTQAIWETPNKKISLSKFSGKVSGEISTADEFTWPLVRQALQRGALVEIESKEVGKIDKAEALVDIAEQASEKNQIKQTTTQYMRKLRKEQLLDKIDTIKNPHLLASMIEAESHGRNTSKRMRPDVLDALKVRLEQVQAAQTAGSSMVAVAEIDEPKEVKYQPQI